MFLNTFFRLGKKLRNNEVELPPIAATRHVDGLDGGKEREMAYLDSSSAWNFCTS